MRGRILIVQQDDELNRKIMTRLLELDFETNQVPDAMLGIQYAIRLRPNCVIVDLQCAAGGAFGLIQNLRKSLFTKNIPVFVLASERNALTSKKLLELGILTYFQKPFPIEDLVLEIEKACATGRVVSSGDFRSPYLGSSTPQSSVPSKQVS